MARKVILYCLLVIVFIAGRLVEGWTTYQATPDLAKEMNPVASVLGGGWGAIIFLNVLAGVLLFAGTFQYFFCYKPPKDLAIEAADYKDYISNLYYGASDRFTWIWKGKRPQQSKYMLYHLSYSLLLALIAISVFFAIHNYLTLAPGNAYSGFVRAIPLLKSTYVYVVAIGLAVVSFYWVIKSEYVQLLDTSN